MSNVPSADLASGDGRGHRWITVMRPAASVESYAATAIRAWAGSLMIRRGCALLLTIWRGWRHDDHLGRDRRLQVHELGEGLTCRQRCGRRPWRTWVSSPTRLPSLPR